jgi:PadR family transcriptional regulator
VEISPANPFFGNFRSLIYDFAEAKQKCLYVSLLCISLIVMRCGGHGHQRHGCCHYSGGGLIQLVVLRILFEKPSHGYQIMEQLEQITSKQYSPEPGALYTILRRLEERGLVTSEWEKKEAGADRRVYTLTEDGIQVLKEGLETSKERSQLMNNLSQFYDEHFAETNAGGESY